MKTDNVTILEKLAEWYRGDAPDDMEPPFTPEEMGDACAAGAAAIVSGCGALSGSGGVVLRASPRATKQDKLNAKKEKLKEKLKGKKA